MPRTPAANTSTSPARSSTENRSALAETGKPKDAAGGSVEGTAGPTPAAASGQFARDLTIRNKRGLHARASAKFVQLVERFNAEVSVTRGSETVGGTSIMGLMMLSASPGTSIVVSATGPEAEAAVAAIAQLVESKFNEE